MVYICVRLKQNGRRLNAGARCPKYVRIRVLYIEIVEISGTSRKAKTLYVNML